MLAAPQKGLQGGDALGDPDPQAAALEAYMTALGLPADAAPIQPWLSLLAVVFFELGAAASLIVVQAANGELAADKRSAPEFSEKPETVPAPVGQPVAAARGRKRSVRLPDVLSRIEANGGKIDGSLTGIAKLIGTPTKASAHRALNVLAAAGLVTIGATSAGTSVTLVG